ncbi:hypothetical protein IMSHALPRED_000358 [Imshaugia aleurites]|uniref:Uncharacterized protein n=1 Tax=Imshaugia aleurites TaxID=172621 RepID=A0A8H3EUJ0_9LECA|nr:hypothetical protein IMSHALPRED_000358 [Imshaugia aleurites]
MALAIPIISSEVSQLPDQTHGALTPPEHRSSAPPHEQVNASLKSSENPSLNHISDPEIVNPLNESPTSKMREEIRIELRRRWHEIREGELSRTLRWAWDSDSSYGMLSVGMLSVDSSVKSGAAAVKSELLGKFCNKPTTLYWAHSAQRNDRCPRYIWGCIYKEWFRCHDYKPRMDFEHFFANPVRITSTGPTTIFDILETHEYLHNQTSLLLDKIRRGELEKSRMSACLSPQNYKLSPTCRAIIIVLDKLASREDDKFFSGGYISLDEEVQKQNVLMVRTGDESGLSEPINFESVRERALPLARPDLNPHDGIEAIRVTLATAVGFVVDLQRREELAFPESAPSSAVDRALGPTPHHPKESSASTTNADEWVDKLMEIADDEGVDNVWEVRMAVSTVNAMHRGESRPFEIGLYFGNSWR